MLRYIVQRLESCKGFITNKVVVPSLLIKRKHKLNVLSEEVNSAKFSSEEFQYLDEFVTVMTPVAHGLDVLQGEAGKTITLGHLLPTIVVIKRAITQLVGENVCSMLSL